MSIIKRVLMILGALALPVLAFGITFIAMFIPFFPDPDYPQPVDQPQAFQQDLDYLKSFADHEISLDDPGRRKTFLDYVELLESRDGQFTKAEFELAVAQAAAIADNAHTNVSPISRTRRVNHLPIRFGQFAEGLFVVQSLKDHRHLLGHKLLGLEGRTTSQVIEKTTDLFGDVPTGKTHCTNLREYSVVASGTTLTIETDWV